MSYTEMDMIRAAKNTLHDSHDEPMNSMGDVVAVVRKMERERIIALLKSEQKMYASPQFGGGYFFDFIMARFIVQVEEDQA